MDADTALEALRRIRADFAEFCKVHGKVTEADTRAQVIDRMLEEVCGWPRIAIDRERYFRGEGDKRKHLDYGLSINEKTIAIVEAKREGETFTLPHDLQARAPKLNGTLLTDEPVREAIQQVRSYCDDLGVRFAIATNGYTWVVFRAVRDDMPWREGRARVYPSLEYIEQNFTEFWNFLSYGAVQSGSLHSVFGSSVRTSRELRRVSARLFNADLPLARNRLHGQLGPIIKTFFDDIGTADQLRVLQTCYVHSGSLRIVADDFNWLSPTRFHLFWQIRVQRN